MSEKTDYAKMVDEISRNDWKDFTPESWQSLSDYASAMSVLAAEISEYAGKRGGYGCGDSGHESAMKSAQKMRKRVRKALGYSYP